MSTKVKLTIPLEGSGKRSGHCLIPYSSNRSAYGSVALPVGVIENGDGPTVLLTGGLHGDEYEGQIAVRGLFNDLTQEAVSGRLVFLPFLNMPASRQATRVSPIDDLNLNRIFPGDVNGTPTEQIAAFLNEVLLPPADVWIDLHSGGTSLEYLPCVARHRSRDPQRDAKGMALLKAFGGSSGLVWESFTEPGQGVFTAEENDVVYLTSELGGAGRVDHGGTSLAEAGLRRCLESISALRLQAARDEKKMEILSVDHGRDYYVADTYGLFRSVVELGDVVKPGQILGELHPSWDFETPVTQIYARDEGVVVCRRHLAHSEPGDVLFHLAQPLDND